MQVSGVKNTTFAVCLDQDEKKILQSVTRYGSRSNLCPLLSYLTNSASNCLLPVSVSLSAWKRCEISVCYKPDSSTDWRLRKSQTTAQIQPINSTFCSLLCLPIVTFSGALPWNDWLLESKDSRNKGLRKESTFDLIVFLPVILKLLKWRKCNRFWWKFC